MSMLLVRIISKIIISKTSNSMVLLEAVVAAHVTQPSLEAFATFRWLLV